MRTYIISFLFLAIFINLKSYAGEKPLPVENDSTLQKCKMLYNDGLYKEIVALYKHKKKEEIKTDEFYYMGLSFTALQNLSWAERSFKFASEREPGKIKYLMQHGRVLAQLGRKDEAEEKFKTIINIDSVNIPALFELGSSYFANKEWENSCSVYSKLVKIDSTSIMANYYLANSLNNKKVTSEDSALVKTCLMRCLYYNDDFTPALDLLGSVYYNENNISYSLALFNKAANLNPNNPYYFYRTGLCYEKKEDFKLSSGFFVKAIKLDSTVSKYHQHLGFTYYNLNNLDSAVLHYKTAIQLDRLNINNYIDLGLTLLKAKKDTEALEAFNAAVKIFPTGKLADIYGKIASVYQLQNNSEEAKEAFEKVLQFDSENIDALFGLGFINDELKNYKTAKKLYNKVLALTGNNPTKEEKTLYIKKRLADLKEK